MYKRKPVVFFQLLFYSIIKWFMPEKKTFWGCKKLRKQSGFWVLQTPREMKIEDRPRPRRPPRPRQEGSKVKVDSKRWIQLFFSLLRHAWPLDPPFQRRLMPFLPASTKRQAEEKMTFTCDVQWIPTYTFKTRWLPRGWFRKVFSLLRYTVMNIRLRAVAK